MFTKEDTKKSEQYSVKITQNTAHLEKANTDFIILIPPFNL